ncbi:hypothetical protein HDU98_012235 [Podochytrium sp. JEL0797]|nr:hypothetical protein HDU98_012235 [Podochytrium sp. JEL0797]
MKPEAADLFETFARLLTAHPPSTLTEFGFVPPVASLSPLPETDPFSPFVIVEGNLGVPANAIPGLCRASHKVFFGLAGRFDRDPVGGLTGEELDRLEVSSKCLVLMNPEIYTAWNVRKKLLNLHHPTLSLHQELALIDLVLSKHPKRPAAWSHRAWVLPQLLATASDPILMLEHELRVCDQAAQRHRMNYHAWSHRWKVVRDASLEFKLSAFETTKSYIQSHISEHSAFAHALSVLETILNDPQFLDRDAFLLNETRTTMGLIVAYPGHKSPWCYLQGLFVIVAARGGGGSDFELGDVLARVGSVFVGGGEKLGVEGDQISEIDASDWMQPYLESEWDVWRYNGSDAFLVALFRFARWIVEASETVIRSRGDVGGGAGVTKWKEQVEVALDFQMYLLLGRQGCEGVREEMKEKVRECGGWPAFLFRMD